MRREVERGVHVLGEDAVERVAERDLLVAQSPHAGDDGLHRLADGLHRSLAGCRRKLARRWRTWSWTTSTTRREVVK